MVDEKSDYLLYVCMYVCCHEKALIEDSSLMLHCRHHKGNDVLDCTNEAPLVGTDI